MMMNGPLPYTDSKPQGAADFYFAINATFRFIRRTLGEEALRSYWSEMGSAYLAPVAERWRAGGLPAVASYWQAFFGAEPGGEVAIEASDSRVLLDIAVCPAIHHLRKNGRVIDSGFCQHCYYVTEAAARNADLTVRIQGGSGHCRQTFLPSGANAEPQRIEDINQVL